MGRQAVWNVGTRELSRCSRPRTTSTLCGGMAQDAPKSDIPLLLERRLGTSTRRLDREERGRLVVRSGVRMQERSGLRWSDDHLSTKHPPVMRTARPGKGRARRRESNGGGFGSRIAKMVSSCLCRLACLVALASSLSSLSVSCVSAPQVFLASPASGGGSEFKSSDQRRFLLPWHHHHGTGPLDWLSVCSSEPDRGALLALDAAKARLSIGQDGRSAR